VPNGDYFMAQYIVDGPGVAVTPMGCYEYCQASSPFPSKLSLDKVFGTNDHYSIPTLKTGAAWHTNSSGSLLLSRPVATFIVAACMMILRSPIQLLSACGMTSPVIPQP
jgi:hypothetical protein